MSPRTVEYHDKGEVGWHVLIQGKSCSVKGIIGIITVWGVYYNQYNSSREKKVAEEWLAVWAE